MHQEKAKKLFTAHSSIQTLYFTSDGTPFQETNSAANHAKTLDDKNVETINRHEVIKAVTKAADNEDTAKPEVTKPAAKTKAPAAPKVKAPAKDKAPAVATSEPVAQDPASQVQVEPETAQV